MNTRDRMQVAAFHAIYKRFRKADKPRMKEMDFAEAICVTSDDVMAGVSDESVREWKEKFNG